MTNKGNTSKTAEGHAPADFYDVLAPFYHLIYPDWEKSVKRQGAALNRVIGELLPGAGTLLDVSYAIGTDRLIALMTEAGFTEVRRLDGRFFQPLIVGLRQEGNHG